MRIAVMGSGGVGGYFGGRLAKGGADVAFVARGAHLAAIREAGLRIEAPDGALHLPNVEATDDPRTIGTVDLVLFAVKLWDTEAAIRQIEPLVGAETTIVSFQNGVLKDEYLRAAFPPAKLMGGVGYIATTISRPGVIQKSGALERLVFGDSDGPVRLGPRSCSPPALAAG